MIATLHFATLVVATVFAAAAAFWMDWMLLRAMFLLMQPATARRAPQNRGLVRGTMQVAQAYAHRR